VAVLGRGVMGSTHVAAWRSLGVDAEMFGRDGVERALAGWNIVDICTPTPTHPELTLAAAAAARAVICEKPLALTVADARRMARACEAAGVPLLPAHVVRWFPDYARAKRLVEAGELGSLRELRFARQAPAPTWSPWFADPQSSGGLITDLLIHDLDVARWIAGEVVAVSAATTHSGDGLAGTSASVQLQHAGGAVSLIEGSWTSPGTPFASPFSIVGSRDEFNGDEATNGRDPYADQLAELLAAIVEGTPARVDGSDGVEAVRIAELARACTARPSAV